MFPRAREENHQKDSSKTPSALPISISIDIITITCKNIKGYQNNMEGRGEKERSLRVCVRSYFEYSKATTTVL
jgi:hypothetical protein